ncbi:MAG: gramicidin biosynthesis protein, partial [Proteobacteria bacterium]|nr:gramicidin biosynthesis protein [Pseudomonadota bacterium]
MKIRKKIEAIYPANSLQQGFIFHSLSQPDDDAYQVQLLFDYQQAINPINYKKAWLSSIKTFPALRTCFNWKEDIIQVIYEEGDLVFIEHDISHEVDKNKAIESIRIKDRSEPFDLTKPKLLRVYLIKQSENLYTVLKSEHHAILDGWSVPILLNTVHEYYNAYMRHEQPKIQVERSYLHAQEYIAKHQNNAKDYWDSLLKTSKDANNLNVLLDKQIDLDQATVVHKPRVAYLKIDTKKYLEIQRLAKEEGLTLNVLVQYAWHKLLRVYTQDEQTIVGTTISGRSIPVTGIEHSVGLYINTLPLVLDWNTDRTVRAQLNEIHARITEMNNHCYVNLSKLQTGGRRLFHSLLVFENYPLPENQGGSDKLVALMRESIEKVDYALALVVVERQGMLELRLKYDGELLSEGRAQSYLETISEILNGLSEEIEKQDEEFSLLTKEKSQELIHGWNEASYTNDRKDLVSLFESQAKVRGEESALWCRGESLSYEALNKRSNQVARY